jgi:hypothetical protein
LTPGDNSAAIRGAGGLSVTLLRFISEGLGALGADWRTIHYNRVITGEKWIEVEKRPSSMLTRLVSGNFPDRAHDKRIRLSAMPMVSL